MLYLVTVAEHGRYAKTKGMVMAGLSDRGARYAINARDDDDAYAKLCHAFMPADHRPVSGRSYMRHCRKVEVGQHVYVSGGYAVGYHDDGRKRVEHDAKIAELYTDNALCLAFAGHPFVDFGLSELAERVM